MEGTVTLSIKEFEKLKLEIKLLEDENDELKKGYAITKSFFGGMNIYTKKKLDQHIEEKISFYSDENRRLSTLFKSLKEDKRFCRRYKHLVKVLNT